MVETDDFIVDLAAKRVTTADGRIRLTSTEWHIVELLVRNAGKLVTQRQLLQEVWGPQYERRRTTSASTSPRSAASWNPIRPGPYFITEARMGDRFEPVRPDRDGRT